MTGRQRAPPITPPSMSENDKQPSADSLFPQSFSSFFWSLISPASQQSQEHSRTPSTSSGLLQPFLQCSDDGIDSPHVRLSSSSLAPARSATAPVDSSPDYEESSPLSTRRASIASLVSDVSPLTLIDRDSSSEPLLTETIAVEIRKRLPRLLRLATRWRLVYSLDQHGISLSTLYARCETAVRDGLVHPRGAILLLSDVGGAVFGAFLSDFLQLNQGFYGNGETFVFKVIDTQPTPLIVDSLLTADPENENNNHDDDDDNNNNSNTTTTTTIETSDHLVENITALNEIPVFPRAHIDRSWVDVHKPLTSTNSIPRAHVPILKSDGFHTTSSQQFEHLENYLAEPIHPTSSSSLPTVLSTTLIRPSSAATSSSQIHSTPPSKSTPVEVTSSILPTKRTISVFPWTGKNDYFELSEQHYFAVGAGDGNFAIYLDRNLEYGSSACVPTFDNEVLCTTVNSPTSLNTTISPAIGLDYTMPPSSSNSSDTKTNFVCVSLELWGIVD